MTTKLVTKVTLTTFSPKNHYEAIQKNGRAALGSIVGIANKIVISKGADGVTEFEGLAGDFAAILPNGDQVRSGKCFLPDAFMEPILAALRDEVNDEGEVVREGVSSLQFAYDVAAIKAENPAGYSWELSPKIEATENDPLAGLLKIAAPEAVAQVENKSGK